MRNKRVALLVCVLLLGLSLPGRGVEGRGKIDFTGLLKGFLQYLEVGTVGCSVTVTCSSGGAILSCSGTTCTKEDKRCVQCDKGTAQFCPGTTGTTCGTSTSSSSDLPVFLEE